MDCYFLKKGFLMLNKSKKQKYNEKSYEFGLILLTKGPILLYILSNLGVSDSISLFRAFPKAILIARKNSLYVNDFIKKKNDYKC